MLQDNIEINDQEQMAFVPFDPQYKSCTIPNVSYHRSTNKQQQKPQKQKDFQSQGISTTQHIVQTFRSPFLFMMVLGGIFILGLYLFVLCQPKKSRESLAANDSLPTLSNCLTSFRQLDCNYDNPSGEACLRLKKCIMSVNQNNSKMQLLIASNDEKKIDAVEELLQNILLFLSGVGATGSLTFLLHKIANIIKFLGIFKGSSIDNPTIKKTQKK